ncbi:hypothetical protein Dsin_005706 [Dipteronia sinensis]|uniref:Uncharacterized protein n=1 Tax=Dipteronia sinensis TaxID=43782 RepID=A0AAE0AYF0_9ROSI|nr:hypothetical protein Dsin_005706 [Dipteronia sinensis]
MRSGWRVRMGGEFVFGSRGTTKSGLNFVGLYREQTRLLGNICTADILNVKHRVPYNGDPALEDEEVLNSRPNSVQPGEDDVERMASSYGWRIRIWVAWDNQIWAELRGPLQRANEHLVPYNGDPALEDEEVLNSRPNSVQPGEDDAERMASSYGWRIRIWVAWDNQIWAELRGPLQRANEVGFSIIICFRKSQDKPNIYYEDFVFCNGLQ